MHEIFLAGSTQALKFCLVCSIYPMVCTLTSLLFRKQIFFFCKDGLISKKILNIVDEQYQLSSQASNLFQIEITTIVLQLSHDSDFQKT